MIDMREIEWFNRKYKFKLHKVSDNVAYISDGFGGEWTIEVYSPWTWGRKHIVVMHKNYSGNKNGWHEHRRFYDYKWAMGNINNHRKKSLGVHSHSQKRYTA